MTAIHGDDAPSGRAAVDDVIRRMRAAATRAGQHDGPGSAGTADPDVLRTVLATLPHDDQRLLWDRHVVGRDLGAIASELGLHGRAVLRRLGRAERRLAAAFAAAHARACPPGCVDTRQSLHAYARHRLTPGRRTTLESHLFGCDGCMRAFIDVREARWALRDAGPLLLAGTAASGAATPVVVGALGAGTAGAGALAWTGPVGAALAVAWEWVRALALRLTHLGKVGLIGAGAVAGVAVAAVAVAMSGGGGGPVAAPPVPSATSSAAAPAPGDDPTPEAPPEPTPGSTSSPAPGPTDPTEPTEPTVPSTGDPTSPTSTPTQEPGTPEPPSTTPTPGPTGSTPSSTPEPSQPSSSPSPSPSGTPSPDPTPSGEPTPDPTPTDEPTPDPTPTDEPTPDPTPTDEPDPVPTTVEAEVPGLRGVFRVEVSDPDTQQVVGVESGDSWIRARECDGGGWYVASTRYDEADVSVEVEAPPGAEPQVTLERTGIWPGWLKTC